MQLLTNLAGPVCILDTPTEQTGFGIIFAVALILFLFGLINLKLYSVVSGKLNTKSVSNLWRRSLLLIGGVLIITILLGFFSGSSETVGYCREGVWTGLQIPLMWVAIVATALIAVITLALGFMILAKLLIMGYRKINSRN